jgi:hypothetical protein
MEGVQVTVYTHFGQISMNDKPRYPSMALFLLLSMKLVYSKENLFAPWF